MTEKLCDKCVRLYKSHAAFCSDCGAMLIPLFRRAGTSEAAIWRTLAKPRMAAVVKGGVVTADYPLCHP
jgi:hypothetical protein